MLEEEIHIAPIIKKVEKDNGKTREKVAFIHNLNKSFGENKVLSNFNAELYKGENLVILGKSGSGKSVLIKCMSGLLTQDSGVINVLGQEVNKLSNKALDRLRRKIGFLFQSNALYDSMTVRENLQFPLRRHIKIDKKKEYNMIMKALISVGLENTVDMMPAELSGGMRKRIALARTLILEPEIILYDEPTTGLDPITGREISNLILEIQKKYNTSSIIISHDMKCIELTANRILVLIDGQCYAQGTYQELKKSKDEKVNLFFK